MCRASCTTDSHENATRICANRAKTERLSRMPAAEKAVKERNCTEMPVAKKGRTDHKCLWQRKMAALIRQANS